MRRSANVSTVNIWYSLMMMNGLNTSGFLRLGQVHEMDPIAIVGGGHVVLGEDGSLNPVCPMGNA
jgi:hypothetical protein